MSTLFKWARSIGCITPLCPGQPAWLQDGNTAFRFCEHCKQAVSKMCTHSTWTRIGP